MFIVADCILTAFLYVWRIFGLTKDFTAPEPNVSTVYINVDFLHLVKINAFVMSSDDLLLTVILWQNSEKRFNWTYYTNTYFFHLC